MDEVERPAVVVNDDAQLAAKAADLRYVDTDQPGWRRKRWGRGFTYLDLHGEHITDKRQRKRIEELVIPPAWTDVWICPHKNGHIQVTGRDAKGRKQYIYHPRWQEKRNETKFTRMLLFGRALTQIREQVDQDLRKHGAPRERVLAAVVRLLQESMIRVGNAEYARDNGSYGLTTMREDHLELNGTHLRFQFKGKSGKMQEASVRDPRVARVVRQMQGLPGQQLFQYVDEEGNQRVVESGDVNEYVNKAIDLEEKFTAKDFRTWGATCHAIRVLKEMGVAEDQKAADANIVELYKRVADYLGNTPAICRDYYVHPAVPECYRQGTFFEICADVEGLPHDEWLDLDEQVALAVLSSNLNGNRG